MNSVTGFNHHTFTGKKKALVLGVALALSTGAAQATQQSCYSFTAAGAVGNFTMLTADGTGTGPTGNGYTFGGTNNVTFTWDGTIFTSSSDYTGPGSTTNATISSPTTFFGSKWTAHDVQIFGPGVYSFNTIQGGTQNMTVNPGQLGAHMLFNWGTNTDIDVVNVWNMNSVFSNCGAAATSGTAENCLWTGASNTVANSSSTVFTFASSDNNGDGTLGVPMADGPFLNYNANFNLQGTFPANAGPGEANDPCAPAVDTNPDPFTFTDVTAASTSTVYTSNAITVSGLGVTQPVPDPNQTAPISITGNAGQYSVSTDNGATWSPYSTTTPATVSNGNMVRVQQTSAATNNTRTDTILTIGAVSDTYSVSTLDTIPAAFTFTDITGATTSTPYTSNAITVSGLDAGAFADISISGNAGAYSINGGAYTSAAAAGAVKNGDTITVQQTSASTNGTKTDTTLTIGGVSDTYSITTAGGLSSTDSNFTMLDPSGGVTGGTNDVVATWDGQSTTNVNSTDFSHISLGSSTPFFGFRWTAHHIRVFGPGGPYVINVDCTTTQLETGTCVPNSDPSRNFTFTVGAGQYAAHMLFDWNTTTNIDVVDIWNVNATFGPSQLFTGPSGCANTTQTWDYMSTDWDGDGINGKKMIDGPFQGFGANFNLRFTQPAVACSAYTPTVNVSDPSNAPGCSISPAPVNVLQRADWWLVAGFLTWLGAIRIRLRRKTQS